MGSSSQEQSSGNFSRDIFADASHDGVQAFMFARTNGMEWLLLVAALAVMILVDALAGMRKTSMGHAAVVIVLVSISLLYNVHYYSAFGAEAGAEWTLGYCLEWILSMDNLFVFLVVVRAFRVPDKLLHTALLFGVLGSIVSRLFLFAAISAVAHPTRWLRVCFGCLLIYSGFMALRDDDEDPANLPVVRFLKRCLGSRLLERYDLERCRPIVRDANGKWCATLLLPVIVCIEATDIVFAIDSISSKVSHISNPFTTFSSSACAVLGLRATFFLIKDAVGYFELLKYGLCVILVFVGVELLLAPWVTLPSSALCIVITSIFIVSIIVSATRKTYEQDHTQDEHLPLVPERRSDVETSAPPGSSIPKSQLPELATASPAGSQQN
mmetsp:Transcript_33297/g.91813  ORF Transcript_33297/g.91813 Transcript_33297/m.91813 type:complete len:383 (+) Transcript_33297:138-1286(+)